MPSLTITAIPGEPGRPPQVKINSDLNPAEALVLLERVKALLLQQNVPALDGAPPMLTADVPAGLAQRLTNGRG